MRPDRVLSLLGLAKKAGKIKDGAVSVEQSVKSGKAFLLVIAEDASNNTADQLQNMCQYYRTDMIKYGTKITLADAIGKEYRSAIAIEDQGFANLIRTEIEKIQP